MRQVQIYVDNVKLDLFQDENIVVNSTIQNVSDIRKVFTDFSQTFTVPASEVNDSVFEWYYQNDYNTTINHNRRRPARIEVDSVPFRTGKMQLESAEIVNKRPQSYKITFYGDVVNLKDIFQEKTLQDINYSSIEFAYTGANVLARVNTPSSTTDYDVRYPFISSSRLWSATGGGSSDITGATGAIVFNELYPAVRVKKILDLIQSQYGLTFTGAWMNTAKFKKLFLWFKNREIDDYFTPPVTVAFANQTGTGGSNVVMSGNTVRYTYNQYAVNQGWMNVRHELKVLITSATTQPYHLDVYLGGQLLTTAYALSGNHTFLVALDNNNIGLDKTFSFKIRSKIAMNFGGTVEYRLKYVSGVPNVVTTTSAITAGATVGNVNLQYYAPQIKILDFINGLVAAFNLTIIGDGANTYKIQPLEDFYAGGVEVDITKYVDLESIQVSRPKLFDQIELKYQESQSFLNKAFEELNGRGYGTLRNAFGYDGGDLNIELPFEIILGQTFTGTNLQVAYSLGTAPEYKSYVPKPVLLYQEDFQTGVSYYFNTGGGAALQTQYQPFGQEITDIERYSTTFNAEVSSFDLNVTLNTLYQVYYEPYLLNLFDTKTRLVDVKCIFPVSIIDEIQLNSSLIIRDKKYIINDMGVNLVNGETNLSLITNQRSSLSFGVTRELDAAPQTVEDGVTVPPNYKVIVQGPPEAKFTTVSPMTWENETVYTIAVDQNMTGVKRVNTIPVLVQKNGKTIQTDYLVIHQDA